MKRLIKIDVNPNSVVLQAKSTEEYRVDQERATWGQFYEGKSPPISYQVIGNIIGEIKVGHAIIMDRYYRLDSDDELIEMRGVFHSSTVQGIEDSDGVTYITTNNSLYKLEDCEF